MFAVRWLIAVIYNTAKIVNLTSLSLCGAPDAFVTYEDVERIQILNGNVFICLPTQASW